jgi:Na+/H+ antiporter NhaC
MSAMVTMLYKGGGGPGLASLFARASKTRRGVQFSAFLLGCCVFFDDYSNILLTGMAMRPLTDLVHISREKLAFSVHSCATALASISPLSSWIGFEISLIDQAYSSLIDNGADLEGKGWTTSAFVVFVKSIPARFYPIVVLTFLVSLIIYNREWGPMLTREREALREGKIVGDDVKDDPGTALDPAMEPEADTPLLWWNGLIPIVTTIGLVILGLCLTGRETAIADGLEPTAVNMFGNADSFRALLWGSFGGVVSCFFLFLLQHKHNGRLVPPSWLRWCLPCCHPVKESKPIMSWAECMHWFVEGVKSLTTAVCMPLPTC